jgi:hypothetical protein
MVNPSPKESGCRRVVPSHRKNGTRKSVKRKTDYTKHKKKL